MTGQFMFRRALNSFSRRRAFLAVLISTLANCDSRPVGVGFPEHTHAGRKSLHAITAIWRSSQVITDSSNFVLSGHEPRTLRLRLRTKCLLR